MLPNMRLNQRRGIQLIEQDLIQTNTLVGVFMVQNEDKNPLHFDLFLNGPGDSPYEGYQFQLDIQYSKDHPFRPPKIRILNNIYHFNIHDGQLPFDILKDQWHPRTQMFEIINLLKNLMINPNELLYKDEKQHDIYINDREQYMKYAKEYTQLFATKINQQE